MKKTLLYLIMAAGLVGCAKELTPASEENPAGKPVTFEIKVLETKAAKSDWATGDEIYVFFMGIDDKYLKLTYDGGGWDESCPAGDLLDTDFAGLSDYALVAVHFPVPVDVQNGGGGYFHFDKVGFMGEPVTSYYLFEDEKAYTVDDATVTATLSLAKPDDVVLFHIPGIQDNLSDYTFRCTNVTHVHCEIFAESAMIVEVCQTDPETGLFGFADADGAVFTAGLATLDAEDYIFTLEGPEKTYTLTRKSKALVPGKMYNFPPLDDPEWSVAENKSGFINGYQYVNMGNGMKWATMNVGGADPTDDGDFYAWGVTEPTEGYTWGSYKWASIPDGVVDTDGWKYLTKYTYDDGETNAIWYDAEANYIGDNDVDYSSHDYEDDAARQEWGATWRTPTSADWQWLIENCSWAWVDNYDGTSVSGMLVTSNVEGYTDCSIFLPAAQHPQSTGFAGGDYWAADLATSWNSSSAKFLHFAYDDFGGNKRMNIIPRNELLVIRPVSD